jgi:hypothetical protein
MKEALANYVVTKKRTKAGKVYDSPRIYLPTKLTSDSNFPFKEDIVRIQVKVKRRQLVIKKASKRILQKLGELEMAEEAIP